MIDSKTINGLKDQVNDFQKMLDTMGGINGLQQKTMDMLPKDAFDAEIDGHKINVSLAVSGRSIVIVFHDDIKAASVYNDLKQQKKGFFERIFRK